MFPYKTKSICPHCLEENYVKVLEAELFEKNNEIFMGKNCEQHGYFEERIGDKELLERWKIWEIEGERKIAITEPKYGCPKDCGLCKNHSSQTNLGIIDITNRCNFNCLICFDVAGKVPYLYEPSLEEIKVSMQVLRKSGANALQLTGGEPTIFGDYLIKYVKLAKALGFDHVEVNTNGWLVVERGANYIRKLREAGLSTFYLSFDGLTPEPYKQKIGEQPNPKEVLKRKKEFIEVCREADFNSVVLVPTLVNGINTDQVWEIIRYGLKNSDVVRCINFQPVSITGRINKSEREKMRVTNSDLVKLIESQSKGLISRYDFYPGSFLSPISDIVSMAKGREYLKFSYHPWCGVATFMLNENGEWQPITRYGNLERLMDDLRNIYEKWERSKIKSLMKHIGIIKMWLSLKKNLEREMCKSIMQVIKGATYRKLGDFMRKIVMIGSMHFMDPFNFDLERVRKCTIHYGLPNGKIIPFCTMNTIHREKIMQLYSKPLS